MSLESVFANPPTLAGVANKASEEEAKERSSNQREPTLLYFTLITKYFTTFYRMLMKRKQAKGNRKMPFVQWANKL